MRSVRAMAAAFLCAATGEAFVMPLIGSVRSRDTSMRTAMTTTARWRGYRPSMSLASPPSSVPSAPGSETARSTIQPIASQDELLSSLAEHQDTLVVIKFYDQFCRACDEIRPRYEELARNTEACRFFEIEFTTCKDVCKMLGIRRLPTVHIYDGGNGRVADLPAGPSRFSQVEKRLSELVAERRGSSLE